MQLIAYILASSVAFAADTLALLLLAKLWLTPPLSAAIAFVIGLLVNFVLCRQLIFPDSRQTDLPTQFGGFVLSGLGGLLLTVILIESLVSQLNWPLLLAKLFAAAGVVILNFYIRSTFVFKQM
ncbi:GtrA family protein [Tepidimonas taiwanensis]|uniref:GtrA family protein n=1 Tax=Tepidimonas taiwanensis TaxID=307486 RepID=UPI000734BE26|nr:GtrA family protein [Tepidimonas taiwanensis]